MLGPRHLEHLMLAVFFADLFHAADMIDMRMSEDDAIDIVAVE